MAKQVRLTLQKAIAKANYAVLKQVKNRSA
jgi:hypothetical protein